MILNSRGEAFNLKPRALGGYEGASRTSRELASWSPSRRSADGDVLPAKCDLDARSQDMASNDGYTAGGVAIHKDGIVGHHFKLNAKPNHKALGLTDAWAREFQEVVEARFTLWAESPRNWVDAAGRNNFTELIRLAVGIYPVTGEVLATAEWLRDAARPYHTAIQFVDSARLSNPRGQADTARMRGGITSNSRGAPQTYHFRTSHPGDYFRGQDIQRWKSVAARKPWGRTQVIHIYEQARVDQSRGIGDMVQVLKQMKMTRKFQDIVLQNAVVNAMYAAVIESDLPTEAALSMVGATSSGEETGFIENYLSAVEDFTGSSKNLNIDGVKIPHLVPGSSLKLLSAGDPAALGTGFEQSLLRHIASGLGLSYEQFSRDYTQTNYSSARASMGETWKFFQSRKKVCADRLASEIYALWLEEELNSGNLPLPAGAPNFYDGINKEAYCNASWIGASRGQIDELKETQAAVARIAAGISTHEKECARFGDDFRDVFAQLKREKDLQKELGLEIELNANGKTGSSNGGGASGDDQPRATDGKFGNPKEDEEEDDEGNNDDEA